MGDGVERSLPLRGRERGGREGSSVEPAVGVHDRGSEVGDELREGGFARLDHGSSDSIGVDGPYGMAYLREDAPRDVVCIAGGSGLSPMISIARGFAASDALKQHQLHFFYGGRRRRDICGEAILSTLAGFGSRIHYHPVISEAADDAEGASWSGLTGFVHEAALQVIGEDKLKDHEVYFAGPPLMAQAAHKMLFHAKVPTTQIHFDQFY